MRDDIRGGAKGKTRHVGRRHQGDPENYEDHLNGAPVDYGDALSAAGERTGHAPDAIPSSRR